MGKESVACSWDTLEDCSTANCMVLGGGSSPCNISIKSQTAIGKVRVLSSARNCELRKKGCYLRTTRASSIDGDQYMLEIDVQVRLCFQAASCPQVTETYFPIVCISEPYERMIVHFNTTYQTRERVVIILQQVLRA